MTLQGQMNLFKYTTWEQDHL